MKEETKFALILVGAFAIPFIFILIFPALGFGILCGMICHKLLA